MKRWLVRGGIALGVLVLLIVAFYVEENWRGARLWAATKAEYEAKGFSFDPKSLIPPPIPDEENFAASPIWKHLIAASDSKTKNAERPKSAVLDARRAFQEWRSKNKPYTNWQLGVKPNVPPANLFNGTEDELNQIYAAAKRTSAQFRVDYTGQFPAEIPLPHLSPSISVAQFLLYHSQFALDANQSEAAFKDVLGIIKIATANANDPILISLLVSSSVQQQALSTIWLGLVGHQWSDAQLKELQSQLALLDYLQIYDHCTRGEAILFQAANIDWQRNNRFKARQKLEDFFKDRDDSFGDNTLWRRAAILYPNGWYDEIKAIAIQIAFQRLLPVVNQQTHRVNFQSSINNPELETTLPRQPLSNYLRLSLNACADIPQKAAQSQAYIDMAQVACGLERYWLVNKKYPATLAELEPKFIAKVPHDLCNGEPLHYRVEADGNYALYSVGFNGTDDGGKVVMKKDAATAIDPRLGDWVWPRQGFSQSSPRR